MSVVANVILLDPPKVKVESKTNGSLFPTTSPLPSSTAVWYLWIKIPASLEPDGPLFNVKVLSATLIVVLLTEVVKPLTYKLPEIKVSWPTWRFLPIPTPPSTTRAPEPVPSLWAVALILVIPPTFRFFWTAIPPDKTNAPLEVLSLW